MKSLLKNRSQNSPIDKINTLFTFEKFERAVSKEAENIVLAFSVTWSYRIDSLIIQFYI